MLISWFLTGIGSAAFHGTQTWWAEVLDEAGMLAGSTSSSFALYDLHPLTTGVRGAIFYRAFGAYIVISSLIYLVTNIHELFAVCYILSLLVLVLLSATIPVNLKMYASKMHSEDSTGMSKIQGLLKAGPRAGIPAALVSLGGYILWHVDQMCVRENWSILPDHPYEAYWYHWTHSAWHALTAIGIHIFCYGAISARLHISKSALVMRPDTKSLVSLKPLKDVSRVSLGIPRRRTY